MMPAYDPFDDDLDDLFFAGPEPWDYDPDLDPIDDELAELAAVEELP